MATETALRGARFPFTPPFPLVCECVSASRGVDCSEVGEGGVDVDGPAPRGDTFAGELLRGEASHFRGEIFAGERLRGEASRFRGEMREGETLRGDIDFVLFIILSRSRASSSSFSIIDGVRTTKKKHKYNVNRGRE